MKSIPFSLQAVPNDFEHAPLEVELLVSDSARRTSRTEPDAIDALVNELHRVAESKEAT